jgi:hypothetical protein
MRSLWVQFSQGRAPADWVEVDLFAGDRLPQGRYVNALAYQGLIWEGFDTLSAWVEGSDLVVWAACDDLADWSGERWAKVIRIPPLSADPNFGGALNTRATVTTYAEGASATLLTNAGTAVLPFADLPTPQGDIMSGIWLANAEYAAHKAARRLPSWRLWTDGVDPTQVGPSGVIPQRPQGRYNVPTGTRTYYQTLTPSAAALHGADFELIAVRDVPAIGQTLTLSVSPNETEVVAWYTEAPEPGRVDWPNGDYRAQFDVIAIGVDLIFGVRDIGTALGHFGRVDAALAEDKETHEQAEAAFSGAGLKLATYTGGFLDGLDTDRLEVLVAADRVVGHGSQDLTLSLDADAFIDAPYPGGNAGPPQGVVTATAEVTTLQAASTEVVAVSTPLSTEIV